MKVRNLEFTAQNAGNLKKNIVSMQSIPLVSFFFSGISGPEEWECGGMGDEGGGDVSAYLQKLSSPENDSQQSLGLMQS